AEDVARQLNPPRDLLPSPGAALAPPLTAEGFRPMQTIVAYRLACAWLAALFLLPAPLGAQQWPAKPITIVNGFPAGAGTDIVLRMFQDSLEKDLGTRLVFEYKTGDGGKV